MSIRISNLGTTPLSYALSWDRSGGHANYLNMLNLLNMHDRMEFNGEANTRSGMVDVNAFYPSMKATKIENVSGYPLSKSRIRKQNFRYKVPPESETTKRMNKKGINLAYLGAHGI